MDIPAAFEFSIEVSGATEVPVTGTDVIIDFGRAKVETCGYVPTRAVQNVVADDPNSRMLTIAEQHERLGGGA